MMFVINMREAHLWGGAKKLILNRARMDQLVATEKALGVQFSKVCKYLSCVVAVASDCCLPLLRLANKSFT